MIFCLSQGTRYPLGNVIKSTQAINHLQGKSLAKAIGSRPGFLTKHLQPASNRNFLIIITLVERFLPAGGAGLGTGLLDSRSAGHRAAFAAGQPTAESLDDFLIRHLEGYHRVDALTDLRQQVRQTIGLDQRAGKTVQQSTSAEIVLLETILDDFQHKFIGNQFTCGHDGFDLSA